MFKTELPKRVKGTGHRKDEEVETHPAYGACMVSRVTGQIKLHGSALDQHGSFIVLTVRKAERIHHLHQDWHHPTDVLIEVAMSHAQFAEMITTPNIGSGIPCTIQSFGGKRVSAISFETETEAKKVVEGFREHQEEFVAGMRERLDKVAGILEKKSINKADRKEIMSVLESAVTEMSSNQPFVVEQFQRAAEKVVTQGKTELDAMVSGAVNRLGLKSLKQLAEAASDQDVPQLAEGVCPQCGGYAHWHKNGCPLLISPAKEVLEMERGDFPRVSMEQCVKGRAYRLWCRNLSFGVYDGEQGFIGIRTKFGSRFLDTEYHWDQGPPFGTVRGQEDLGVDVPDGVEAREDFGSEDQKTGRPVRFDSPRDEGGRGWMFADTDEPCPLDEKGRQDVRPCRKLNTELFRFLEELEKKFDNQLLLAHDTVVLQHPFYWYSKRAKAQGETK